MTDQARHGEAAPRAPLSSSSMRLPVRVRTQAEFVLAKFCREQIAPAVADQVRLEYEVHGLTAILVERRPPWPSQTPDEEWQRIPIARFRFTVDSARWTLDWPDRDDRWHRYEFTGAKTLAGLLREVDRDPTGIFWG
ncbi:MAG: DUF3024 domain-containing protein [Chloroflexi bacterium]|nr:MAG: DUF3024 domain-containing protein [Chloroflexota bacterium]